MQNINEKFKDMHPAKTVETIQAALRAVGIELEETWHDSGLENCWSLTVATKDTHSFSTNGKGVTAELARASAYGEFIERLQCGLLVYKFQSIIRDGAMDLQSFAPDGKYMTMQELEEDGEWMDHIIRTYGGGLTRKKLAQQCRVYACADDDRIWTIPFYSLFEKKYVYLPAGFVEQIYASNGCCAGNTREEAWVHAFSEMMERHSTISMLTSGRAAPPIPEDVIKNFPTACKTLDAIRADGRYDVRIFDFSIGNGFPVVATRIIDRKAHGYLVNVAADPVLEIAVDRTLTEIFQGRNLHTFSSRHTDSSLEEMKGIPAAHNVLNQLENGNGLFSLDFFAEELSCDRSCADFPDHRGKTNRELLDYMLELYRKLDRPVYVRNYSFLGFPSYYFVVPGFSESRGLRLLEAVPEFALGDMVHGALRDVTSADAGQLKMLMTYHKKLSTAFGRRNDFRRLAGLPLTAKRNRMLLAVTLSYAAWKLGMYPQAAGYLEPLLRDNSTEESVREYFSCVKRYLSLKNVGAEEEKLRLVLEKCYEPEHTARLFAALDAGKSPYEDYLLRCHLTDCESCRYREDCSYFRVREVIGAAGAVYRTFTDGQKEENFAI